MLMRPLTKYLAGPVICGGLLAALPAATLASDGFTAIHMQNQMIGSDVTAYWQSLAPDGAMLPADGFMSIHMDNQKIGSDVTAFWQSL